MDKSDLTETPQRLVPLPEEVIRAGWEYGDDEPLVSICCATYNHVSFIEDALCGFLSQKTRFPFEVIVRDDCSIDGTVSVLRKYLGLYPNIIRVIFNEVNRFQFGERAFPALISAARGEYIALCEGDDYWIDENKLQTQIEFLENNPTYVITYSDCQIIDRENIRDGVFYGSKKDLSPTDLMKGSSIATLTACFRNKLFGCKYPSELLIAGYGDVALWAYLGQYGGGKYIESLRKSVYRIHSGGVHSSASVDKRLAMRHSTSLALFIYFSNKGDGAIAKYHAAGIYICMMQHFLFRRRSLRGLISNIMLKCLSSLLKR